MNHVPVYAGSVGDWRIYGVDIRGCRSTKKYLRVIFIVVFSLGMLVIVIICSMMAPHLLLTLVALIATKLPVILVFFYFCGLINSGLPDGSAAFHVRTVEGKHALVCVVLAVDLGEDLRLNGIFTLVYLIVMMVVFLVHEVVPLVILFLIVIGIGIWLHVACLYCVIILQVVGVGLIVLMHYFTRIDLILKQLRVLLVINITLHEWTT